MIPALHVYLLGRFALHGDGRPLPAPPTLKSQSLLAYLILHRCHPQPRDRLAGLLWGDWPEDRAHHSLSTAVWRIRRCLPDERLILGDPHAIQFDPHTDLWLDVEALEDLASRSDVPSLQSAVALYRGDFLDGFYDDWVVDERYRLESVFAEALAQLMAGHEARGDHAAALAAARRLLDQDPLREDAHRAAMRACCRLGQRDAALAQYRRCREVVRQQLGAEPMAETTTLYEMILDGHFAVSRPPAGVETISRAGVPVQPAGRSPFDLAAPCPLIGREQEMALLHACWQDVTAAHHAGLVLIGGEAGVGKTRLVREFAEQLRWQGVSVLWGRCYEFERALPYHAIAEALRSVLRALTPTELAALPAWTMAEVARLVPEVSEKWPGLEVTPTRYSGQEQARLFDGLARVLAALAAHRPILVVLEDLQWADDSTLRLVHHLARYLADQPLLIAGTFRPEAVEPEHRLLALQRRLTVEGLVRSLPLSRLSPEAIEAMVVEMSGAGEVVLPLARRLYREAEGNPFHVMEMVKALFETGLVHLAGSTWTGDFARTSAGTIPLPASVGDVIQARVRGLDKDTQQILGVAAVLGREFDFDLLNAVWNRGEEATLEALDDLLRRRLIEEGTGAMGRDYAFTHHTIQEVVYAAQPRRRRQRMHARVGTVMETLYGAQGEALAGELAYHFEHAGQLDKTLTPKVITYLIQAGDCAARLYAEAEARKHYGRALEFLSHLPDTEDNRRRRVDTTIQLVRISFHADRPDKSLAQLAEAEALAQALPAPDGTPGGDRLRLARIHLWKGQGHVCRNELPEAGGYFQQVLPVAQEFGDEELLSIPLSALGRGLASRGQFAQAGEMLSQAIPLLEKTGNWTEWIKVVGNYGVSLASRGDYEGAVAQGQRALARAMEMHSLASLAHSQKTLFWIYCIGRDVPLAVEASRATLEAAQHAGEWMDFYWGLGNRAWAESRVGNHEAAFRFVRQQKELEQRLGGPVAASDIYAAFHTEIAFNAGQVDETLNLAGQAAALAQSFGGVYAEGLTRRVWGQALAALSPPRWDKAEAQLAESVRLHELGDGRMEAAHSHAAWGVVCRDRGHLAAAREHWEKAAAQFEASGLAGELEQTRGLLAGLKA